MMTKEGSVEEKTKDWRGGYAVIFRENGGIWRIPAVFFFDEPGGAAWVSPSYADPYGCPSPAYHKWIGTVDGELMWDNENGTLLFEERNDRRYPEHAEAFDWYFNDYLKSKALSFEDEKKRVRELLLNEQEDVSGGEEIE